MSSIYPMDPDPYEARSGSAPTPPNGDGQPGAPTGDGRPGATHHTGGPQHAPYGAGGPHPSGTGAPAGAGWTDVPPPGVAGVATGPLPGPPVSDADAKLWGMLAHLSAVLGYVLGAGFLGWVGPLVIYLVFRERDRFIRYNAAESLNAAIATLILEVGLGIIIGLFAIVTLGLGTLALPLVAVPALLHFIFAIIGSVKADRREWWNYPINIRLFS